MGDPAASCTESEIPRVGQSQMSGLAPKRGEILRVAVNEVNVMDFEVNLGGDHESLSHVSVIRPPGKTCAVRVLLVRRCQIRDNVCRINLTYLPLNFFEPEVQIIEPDMNGGGECHHVFEAVYLFVLEIRLDIIAEHLQNTPEDRRSL